MTAKAYSLTYNSVCFVTVYIDPKTLKVSMTGFAYPSSDENILEKYYVSELPEILLCNVEVSQLDHWGVCRPLKNWGMKE